MPADTMKLMPLTALGQAADCLRVMAHPIRLRIAEILLQGEFPVHRIAEWCGISPHQTCEHLRWMQSNGLLSSERRGRAVYYRITSPRLPRLMECIAAHCDGEVERKDDLKESVKE